LEITKTVGYKHFCQTPHCQHERCNICPFSSNAEEGDARASREAGLKVIENLESIAPPGEAIAKLKSILNEEEKQSGREIAQAVPAAPAIRTRARARAEAAAIASP
jgi:hypothetical protein